MRLLPQLCYMYIELHAFIVALAVLFCVRLATSWCTRLVCMTRAARYIIWLLVKLTPLTLIFSFLVCMTPLASCVGQQCMDSAMLKSQLQVSLGLQMSKKASDVILLMPCAA